MVLLLTSRTEDLKFNSEYYLSDFAVATLQASSSFLDDKPMNMLGTIQVEHPSHFTR